MTDVRIGRAIVASDDELLRLALSTILTRSVGLAEVAETAKLDDALELLGDHQDIVLALFDIALPGMASPASVGAVRECAPRAKVVVASSSVARRDILAALEAGAHGYVSTRLGAAEITRALQLVLAGSIYVPAILAELPRPSAGRAKPGEGADRPGGRPPALTARQRDVLRLLIEGRSNKEIGRALLLTEGTAKIHVATLLRILGVTNRAAAAVAGARLLNPG